MKKAIISISLVLLVACIAGVLYALNSKLNPKLTWDTTSDSIVIGYERLYEIDYNYIPAFRVWGDGYTVWVEIAPSGERKVWKGYLSQSEIRSLLEQFKDAGFFRQCHKNQGYASDYIRINLSNTSCSGLIGEQLNSNYAAISDLVDTLMSGAGSNGREFVPEVGYLIVVPYEKTEYYQNKKTMQPKYIWPVEKFGFQLEALDNNVPDGKITGDMLKFAWEIVNSPSPFVESNGKNFWIAVTIPKISD